MLIDKEDKVIFFLNTSLKRNYVCYNLLEIDVSLIDISNVHKLDLKIIRCDFYSIVLLGNRVCSENGTC